MDIKKLDYELTKEVEKFELDYKNTLNEFESKIDPEIWNVFYSLGADIKHTFENINNIIVKHLEK